MVSVCPPTCSSSHPPPERFTYIQKKHVIKAIVHVSIYMAAEADTARRGWDDDIHTEGRRLFLNVSHSLTQHIYICWVGR